MTDGEKTPRWRNVPVPEPHVAGLLMGTALHAFIPWPVTRDLPLAWVAGWPLIAAGILLGAWAVRAVGNTDIDEPTALVSTGPYAYSRNPMYLGWTGLYVGIALVLNTVWLFVLLPVVMVATHFTVIREERSLETAFGDDYRDYKNDVRRYL